MRVVTETSIKEYPLLGRGKVRDIYEISPDTLLIVTTDRMSAFDVIMAEPVPYKGVVLNQMTLFWMERFKHIIDNHIIEADAAHFPAALQKYRSELEGRSVLVKKARPVMLECVVRGYISGSGWKDYQKTGTVCGHVLPQGLTESDKLPMPIFTPSTKAELGEHDMNISEAEGEKIVGKDIFEKVRSTTLAMFKDAGAYAEQLNLIIADTKFEFGIVDGKVILIDEVLTPDSSRFWDKKAYTPGKSQPSFDKQYLRDWLASQPWDKTPPPPTLPEDVIKHTAGQYFDAYTIITGNELPIDINVL